MQDMRTELLGVGEAARRLGVSNQTVRNYERRGVLPPARRVSGTGVRVWPIEEIDRLTGSVDRTTGRLVPVGE